MTGRLAALLLAAAPLPGARELPVLDQARGARASVPLRLEREGFRLAVDGTAVLVLPMPGMEVVELDYRAEGPLLLTWTATERSEVPTPKALPWHHQVLAQGAGRATLDLRTTPGWRPARAPFLLLEGSGSLLVTGLRGRPAPPDPAGWQRSLDEAARWGPLRLAHASINHLDTPMWSQVRGVTWAERLGAALLAVTLLGAALVALRRRRWRPAPALALAAAGLMLAGDLLFGLRAWPALELRPAADANDRLRRNLALGPELGALAALARERLGPAARVGVQVPPDDWFAWETLCFHLAPRPCVRVLPGAERHEGLSGVHRLAEAELDAVVYHHAGAPLLPGFAATAAVGPTAYLAERP